MWLFCLPLLLAASFVQGFNPCQDPAEFRPNAKVSSSYTCQEATRVIETNNVTVARCGEAAPLNRTWRFYVQLVGISCCSGIPNDMCGRPFIPCADPTDYVPTAHTTGLGLCSTAVGVLQDLDIEFDSYSCSKGFQGHSTPISHYVQMVGEGCCRSGKGTDVCGVAYQTCRDEADFLPDFEPTKGTSCSAIRSMLRMSGFGSRIGCADSVLDVPVSTYTSLLEGSCCRAGSAVNHACGVPWNPCSNRSDFTPTAEAAIAGHAVGSCSGLVGTLNFHKFTNSMCEHTLETTGLPFRAYVQATETNCCGTGTPLLACGKPYLPCKSMSDFLPNKEVVPGTTCQAVLDSVTNARFSADRCDDTFAEGVPFSTYLKMSEHVCCGLPSLGSGTCGKLVNPCANPSQFDSTAQIMGANCASAMAQMYDISDVLAVNCSTCMTPCLPGSKVTLREMLPQGSSCCGDSAFVNVCEACSATRTPAQRTTTTLPQVKTPASPPRLTDEKDLETLEAEIAALKQDTQQVEKQAFRGAAAPQQCLALSAVALACLSWAVAASV